MRWVPLAPSVAALFAAALLAGCQSPFGAGPQATSPAESTPTEAVPPAFVAYTFRVVVTEERPDGPRLPAEVHASRLDDAGKLGGAIIRPTDGHGVASFTVFDPGTYLVRVLGPVGWTQEGARVEVTPDGVTAAGLVASDGDVFIPLYQADLLYQASLSWTTTVVPPQAGGAPGTAMATVPLAFPDGLAAAYMARLRTGEVFVRWTDSVEGVAPDLSAGLARDGVLWVEGDPAPTSATPGEREAAWSGELPSDGRDGEPRLGAAAVTRTAVVGTVLVHFDATLLFGGQVPPELPPIDCHARAVAMASCLPGLPPLPQSPPLA